MPYIKSDNDRREKLRNGDTALNAGELNYQIFWFVKHSTDLGILNRQLIIKYFVSQFIGKNPNYQKWNDMTGCLTCCWKEIKRRIQPVDLKILRVISDVLASYDKEINTYEDKKIIENGDVE